MLYPVIAIARFVCCAEINILLLLHTDLVQFINLLRLTLSVAVKIHSQQQTTYVREMNSKKTNC